MQRGAEQAGATNLLPIQFDIRIDEPVVDFPVGTNVPGLQLGGTATGLRYVVEGARDFYTLTILEVGGDGTIAVAVPAGLCADLFGNLNYASENLDAVVTYDGTRPTCAVSSDQEGVVNNATMQIALLFSEPVFGLADETLSMLQNATVVRTAGADGDARYLYDVTPTRDGIIAFQVPEDAVTDGAGNGNLASPVFSLIVDSTGPAVHLTSFETPGESNSRFIRVRAQFTEPVVGFERGDIALDRGSLASFTAQDDGRTYIFDVRPDKGPVTLHIPAGAATDAIGNPNRESAPFHRDYDPDRPVAEIVVQSAGRYRGDRVTVEVHFDEPVFGFGEGTLSVSGATAKPVAGNEGEARYVYEVEPEGSRPVQLSIAAGAVQDAAGNGNRPARARFSLPARPEIPLPADAEPGVVAPPLTAE